MAGLGNRWLLSILLPAMLGISLPVASPGQSYDSDIGEVAVFGGGSFGTATHGFVGASSGLAFSRYAMGLIEASFTPLGQITLRDRATIGSPRESRLYDFNLSFHIRYPVRESWAPYGILGGGLLYNTYHLATGPAAAGGRIDNFRFGLVTGGGVRYYIGRDWGIRPELKVIVSSRVFTQLSIGLFCNLPDYWP